MIWQSQFDEVRVCGTAGRDPFLNVTRPNIDGKCPSGTTACVENAFIEDKVCYAPEDHASKCPKTDLRIVETSALS